MVQILCTLVMIAIVVWCIVKKFHATTTIFAVSFLALFIWTLATGQSVMGDASIGNRFLDIFEYAFGITKTQLSGAALTCMVVLGYVGFMNYLKASDMFAVIIAKPLSKLQKPYLLAGMLIVVGALMKLVIPSAIASVSLLIAVLYPVLLRLGCTRATIASALVLSTSVTWGPADGGVALTVALADPNYSVTDFFLRNQVPICLAVIAVMTVVFIFTSKYFDKKENATGMDGMKSLAEVDPKELGIPKFYAIFPILPLFFILLFSGMIIDITMSTVAAVILSICVAFVIHLIAKHKHIVETFNEIQSFYNGMGDYVAKVCFIIVAGSVFSGALNKIGGMSLLVEALNNAGGGTVALTILGVIIGFVTVACTVSYTANLNIFVPFFLSIAKVTGFNSFAMAEVANLTCGLGTGLTPASGTMLFITGTCDVPFPTVLKRNLIPLLCGLVTLVVMTFILY